MARIYFHDWRCLVQYRGRYANGRVAICLVDEYDLGPVATATVNIPEADLAQDEVIIKDYSENTGMVEALEAAGIVERTGRTVEAGWVCVPICRLIDPAAPSAGVGGKDPERAATTPSERYVP